MATVLDERVVLDALAELYAREYEPMVRVAFLIVGSVEAAEDCVQDAFVRVGRRWGDIDAPGGYLRTVVVNRCRDHLRRQQVRRATSLWPSEVEPDLAVGPSVRRSLDRLTGRQRTAIVLRYYLDLSDDEIAHHLGCRRATVRSLVHRGLLRLREVLEP